jgi:hypothetical protein
MNERDEIAQMMQDSAGISWGTEEHFHRFSDLIRAYEREACAKVCESHVRHPSRLHFAEAIRARGNTP